MTELKSADLQSRCEWWAQAVVIIARGQWQLFETPWRAGLQVLQAISGAGEGPDPEPGKAAEPKSLERQAEERVRKGLAPPREVYDVRNRDRVDWLSFPDWARPSDPDLFEGAHEG
jgi:hypothetical protein